MKILIERRQDHLGFSVEMERMKKRKRLKKKNGGGKQDEGGEILEARIENFDDLYPKLEEWKKSVIGKHEWHFKFC